jgi:hypothetical protein
VGLSGALSISISSGDVEVMDGWIVGASSITITSSERCICRMTAALY